jgi:hypothetical protein
LGGINGGRLTDRPFLRLLNANRVEYLLVGGDAVGLAVT